jgi:hypothetical protein
MSKYFEVEESQFVSLRVFVDVTLSDLCFFSSDPIQRAVAAAWKACCGSWFANRHILKIIVRDKITALWTRNRGSGTLGNWETGKLGNWKVGKLGNWETGKTGSWETDGTAGSAVTAGSAGTAGMVKSAGPARTAGTARTARTARTAGKLENWEIAEIGKLGNWEIGELGNWEIGGN